MKHDKWLLPLSIAAGLGITIWFVGDTRPGAVFGAFEGGPRSLDALGAVGVGVYGFFFTLLGVTLGVVYRRLIELRRAGRSTIGSRQILRYLSKSIDYKVALVGAPIVFGLIWRQLSETPLEIYTIIALENGFVSNAIVSQFVTEAGPPRVAGSGVNADELE